MLLNVARVARGISGNGPGRRHVIWVQGCTIRCPGCINPQLLEHRRRSLVHPKRLGVALGVATPSDGLTLLGGEPFEQADALADLVASYRSAGGEHVLCFTGYERTQLEASSDPGVKRLLGGLDVLIDGPFRRAEATASRAPSPSLIASPNQRIHRLRPHTSVSPDIDLEVGLEEGLLSMTGVPGRGDRSRLRRALRNAGLSV